MTKDPRASTVFRSHIGWIGACWMGDAIRGLTFGHATREASLKALGDAGPVVVRRLSPVQRRLKDRLLAFSEGAADTFEGVDVFLDGLTEFQELVLRRCRLIPYGSTLSYAELAASAGRPKAARAVGTAMSKNPIPLVIPCHRVIASNHTIGGYSAAGGLDMKRKLLALEQGI